MQHDSEKASKYNSKGIKKSSIGHTKHKRSQKSEGKLQEKRPSTKMYVETVSPVYQLFKKEKDDTDNKNAAVVTQAKKEPKSATKRLIKEYKEDKEDKEDKEENKGNITTKEEDNNSKEKEELSQRKNKGNVAEKGKGEDKDEGTSEDSIKDKQKENKETNHCHLEANFMSDKEKKAYNSEMDRLAITRPDKYLYEVGQLYKN
eukprot:15366838-Ditylum_brightwellii.AAC.1